MLEPTAELGRGSPAPGTMGPALSWEQAGGRALSELSPGHSLQVGKEGAVCMVEGHVPCRATKGKSPLCTARASTQPQHGDKGT